MRILVTGCAGFIGFHLANRLLADRHEVVGFDAMVPYYDPALKQARLDRLAAQDGFRGEHVDLAEASALRDAFVRAAPDVVVHLAAQAGVRYAVEHPESYIRNNIVATFNLLECLRAAPAAHLLLASTSSAYGGNDRFPFRESDPAARPLNLYAASKLATEQMAHAHAHLWRLPITAFRFFTVYGPWGRPDMAFFKFTRATLAGEPIELYNHGRMERDFTYVDDIVEGIVRLIPLVPDAGHPLVAEDSLSPVAPYRLVNIGTGRTVALLDFVAAIEAACGRAAIRRELPMQPGDVPRTWADASLLQALTGYQPATPVAQGIARFVDWYRGHYGL